MKHYAKERWDEFCMLHYRRDIVGESHNAERGVAKAKKTYRRRERRALKRALNDEVAVEMNGYTDAERNYWLREFESCACDYDDLYYAELYLRESGQWTPDHTRIFATAYKDVLRRSDEAYREYTAA